MPDEEERHDSGETGRALEAAILELLSRRDADKTICVSEAARSVFASAGGGGDSAEGWRDLMEPARQAARRLVATGDVVVTQGGKVVDPATAKGPIRLRRKR